MNQILSVEMPKNNIKTKKKREPGKASTKSVVIFFSIILVVFGIALLVLGFVTNSSNNRNDTTSTNQETAKPRIDVSQNASEVEVEIFSEKQITKIEYSWNNGEPQLHEVSETMFKLKIPSGSNTLKITATDIDGIENTYIKEGLIGEQEANVALKFESDTNKLKIISEEEKVIASIEYHYDNEESTTKQVNDTKAEIEIPIKDGEHDLTVKVTYEDGETREKTEKVYFPEVKVGITGNREQFIVRISDKKTITKIQVNFNGQERISNNVNKTQFEGRLTLKEGKNILILTVENSLGVSIKKTYEWDKN